MKTCDTAIRCLFLYAELVVTLDNFCPTMRLIFLNLRNAVEYEKNARIIQKIIFIIVSPYCAGSILVK